MSQKLRTITETREPIVNCRTSICSTLRRRRFSPRELLEITARRLRCNCRKTSINVTSLITCRFNRKINTISVSQIWLLYIYIYIYIGRERCYERDKGVRGVTGAEEEGEAGAEDEVLPKAE